MADRVPHAATVSSAVVVSIEPPLLALFLATESRMHDAVAASGAAGFTISLLRADDYGLARRFANPARATGWLGLAGLDLLQRDQSPPVLAQAAAWFDCRLHQRVPMGDHTCFVGRVVACERDSAASPLLYHRGRFHGLGQPAAPAAWSTLDRDDLTADW
jgi:flavin reductase (DIM6/NTAB) family NADH-FMN oxidoreductase RutF